MATPIKLPDLGEGVIDVTISRWRVPVGTAVKSGDVILEVATDKVDSEVAATADGTLLQIIAHEGEIVPVSAVLGYIGAAGDRVDATPSAAAPAPTAATAPAAAAPAAGAPAAAPLPAQTKARSKRHPSPSAWPPTSACR